MHIRMVRFLVPWIPLALTACPAQQQQQQQTGPQPDEVKSADTGTTSELRHPKEVHLANIKQLTDGGENAEAYWSFDSTQLIFQTKRPPFKCDQIMRMPIDGSSEPVLVSTGKGTTTCSYFMPGDQEIVYSSTHAIGPECQPVPPPSRDYKWPLHDHEIYKANADGSNLRKLTDRPGYDAEATVCAKDGSIIFTSDRDGDLELYRMDADGKNVKRLTNTPGYDGGAFFSQDCSKIVWRASRFDNEKDLQEFRDLMKQGMVRPNRLEIYVANADGSEPRQVTYLKTAAFAPYFHPSGNRVLFSTNHGSPDPREFNIWAIDVDGSNLEQITFAPGFDGFPMFSWDGKKLAFASNRNNKVRGETNVFVADWVETPASGEKAEVQASAADNFRDQVAWLADDAREGRGIGTKGLDAAADWLVAEFKKHGAVGAADARGGFKQKFDVRVKLERGAGTSLTIAGKKLAATDFVPASISASSSIKGKTVFAGYGIIDDKLGINDYKKVKAKGKIVVVRRFTPTSGKFKDDKLRRRYSDIAYKEYQARKRGAIGVIVIDVPGKGEKQVPDAELPKLFPKGKPVVLPVAFVTRASGKKLVKGSHKVALAVALEPRKAPVYNVVAKIAGGAQNKLPGTVVIGAHYDHLGYGEDGSLEAGKGKIHNGADDNASGTAGLLQAAAYLNEKRSSLRRDVMFIAFTAEESGLLGSGYFVEHLPPGMKHDDIVGMLNMDMIGRLRGNKVTVMGTNTAPEWEGVVTPACKDQRILCATGGDGYGPSDQTSFYRKGVPVLHWFTGAHTDYHKASDDSPGINAMGGARISRAVAMTAESLANRDGRLTYKKTSMPPPKGDTRARGGSLGTIPAYGDSSEQPGMLIGDVRPGGPAAKAGLRGGDRIIKIDNSDIRTVRDLMFVLSEAVPGQKAKITVMRDGKKVTVQAVFGKSRRMR